MKRAAGAGTSVIEVLRLNINQFEQAVGRGDDKTAKRCIDAAELMFRGLRDVASGQGCDVGVCPPVTLERDDMLKDPSVVPPPDQRPAIPPPKNEAFEREWAAAKEINLNGRVYRGCVVPWSPDTFSVRHGYRDAAGAAWIQIRPPGGVTLARLTWAWICCAAGLTWRAVCWLCRGLRRTP